MTRLWHPWVSHNMQIAGWCFYFQLNQSGKSSKRLTSMSWMKCQVNLICTIIEISLASLQYHFTIISNFQYYINEKGAILKNNYELHTISSSKNLLFFFFYDKIITWNKLVSWHRWQQNHHISSAHIISSKFNCSSLEKNH